MIYLKRAIDNLKPRTQQDLFLMPIVLMIFACLIGMVVSLIAGQVQLAAALLGLGCLLFLVGLAIGFTP